MTISESGIDDRFPDAGTSLPCQVNAEKLKQDGIGACLLKPLHLRACCLP